MFAQANSSTAGTDLQRGTGHRWSPAVVVDMIRTTARCSPAGLLSAYRDNGGARGTRGRVVLSDPADGCTAGARPADILIKVRRTITRRRLPFTGCHRFGRRDSRQEPPGAAPGRGLVGFTVSNLRSGTNAVEADHGRRNALPQLEIMLEGPIGAAAFNNEFGRPGILGYFRSFEQRCEQDPPGVVRGYHKPIMLAGGLGAIRRTQVEKLEVPVAAPLVVLGGPAMLIGLGGGAASSQGSGASSADLDFASVQRGNPEMQRRAQEVINHCWSLGADNPIVLIHDVGSRRTLERVARGARTQRARRHRAARRAERRAGDVATRDLVQRGPGALRDRARTRHDQTVRCAVPA